MAASRPSTISATHDRQYLWWALATFLAALAMAIVLTTRDAEAAGGMLGPLPTILLMAAVMCLPFGLAALIAGLALSAHTRLARLRRQLLGYGATLSVAAFLLVFLATNRWPIY